MELSRIDWTIASSTVGMGLWHRRTQFWERMERKESSLHVESWIEPGLAQSRGFRHFDRWPFELNDPSLSPSERTCKRSISRDISMGCFWAYSACLTAVFRALVAFPALWLVVQASATWCTSGRAVHHAILFDRTTAVEDDIVNRAHLGEKNIYKRGISL